MNKKPEPRQYYDVHEMMKYYKIKNMEELFPDCMGLQYITKDLIVEKDEYDVDSLSYKNQVKILEEFGEIVVNVWW